MNDIIPIEQRPNTIFISGEVRSSKNSKQIWKKNYSKSGSRWFYKNKKTNRLEPCTPFITDSEQVKKYKAATVGEFMQNKIKFRNIISGKKYPLYIQFLFVFSKNYRFDYGNMCQVIQDQMVRYGWLTDDNKDLLLPVPPMPPMPVVIIDDNPGVFITVL